MIQTHSPGTQTYTPSMAIIVVNPFTCTMANMCLGAAHGLMAWMAVETEPCATKIKKKLKRKKTNNRNTLAREKKIQIN